MKAMNHHQQQQQEEEEVVVAEYNVSMHCNACERTVAKVISNIPGVEKFMTNMTMHKVIVTGKIDPQQVLQKLRKKTKKKVELIEKEDEDGNNIEEDAWLVHYYGDNEIHMIFNDENANACTIM